GRPRRLDADPGIARPDLLRELGHVGPFREPRFDRGLEPTNETSEPFGTEHQRVDDLVQLLGVESAATERLGEAEDHGHWGTQLMTDPADQLLSARSPLEQRLLRDLELPRPPPLAFEGLDQLLDHGRRDVR